MTRVLRAKFELGLFENPYVDPEEAAKWNGHAQHRQLARQAAREAIVLLKNHSNVLPLKKSIASIAVIGPDAAEMRLGGYSGPGIRKVSILDGIKGTVSQDTKLIFVEGCKREAVETAVVPNEYLRCKSGDTLVPGLQGEYWDNIELAGTPTAQRIDREAQFNWTLFSPDQSISRDWFSARWTGEVLFPATGKVNIGLEGNDRLSLVS